MWDKASYTNLVSHVRLEYTCCSIISHFLNYQTREKISFHKTLPKKRPQRYLFLHPALWCSSWTTAEQNEIIKIAIISSHFPARIDFGIFMSRQLRLLLLVTAHRGRCACWRDIVAFKTATPGSSVGIVTEAARVSIPASAGYIFAWFLFGSRRFGKSSRR